MVTMQPGVRLQDIVEGMEVQSDDLTAYFHRPTGRVLIVSEEALFSAEEGPGGVPGADAPEMEDARGLLAHPDDYVQLPDRFEIDEYRMMERFAAGVPDLSARTDLLEAIRGRGAFRRFKDTLRWHGLAAEWYSYRDRAYAEVARAWCEEHGLVLQSPGPDA